MGTLPFHPTWRLPKAGLHTACPQGCVSLAPWVQSPRPCPTASKGSLTGGPLSQASGPALAGDRFLSGDFALGVSLRD